MGTLAARLRTTATNYPNHLAIVTDAQVLSYQELMQAVGEQAQRLVKAGIGPGARVALCLPNGVDFVISFFAVAHVGGIVVPLNPVLQPTEIAPILAEAQVAGIVTLEEFRDRCSQALHSVRGLPESVILVADAAIDTASPQGAPPPPETATPDDPVLFLYSSGSTGQPKRIERGHMHLLYETERLITTLQLSPTDRVLGVAPFSHVNGLMRSMVASVLAGATLCPLIRFDRRAVAACIETHGVTVFIGVPFMFAILAQTRWPWAVNFTSLRLCISSSAPLPAAISHQFFQQYGQHVRQLYGTTETGTIAVNLTPCVDETLDSVGLPLEGIEVAVFSGDHSRLPAGETGEIGIRSPAATLGYPNLPDETQQAFQNGYFIPGDIGYQDPQGRFYLTGRKSLFINRGGYKVNPYEIESVIEQHPDVQEVAVIGVDMAYGEQQIKAVIVSRQPCTAGDVIDFCRGKVADFKLPSLIEFSPALPKSATGKILRKRLEIRPEGQPTPTC